MDKPTNRSFRLPRPGVALGLLGCIFLFCLIIAGILLPMVQAIVKRPEAAIRILAVLQDLIVFILPAIGMALVVTRLPARLMAVDSFPPLRSILVALATLVVSIPVMNLIIEWNQNWHLLESMASVEAYFRALEDAAQHTTSLLLANATIPSLILSILIVGVLAGFSEELFFRGAFQRVLTMTRINPHAAIWLVAFVFSAFHFQLFGFVPRMLLGAFFGYTLYWSRSLWLPIILHIFNNTLVVIAEYNDSLGSTLSSPLESSSPLEITAVILSLLLTVCGLYLLRSRLNKNCPANG